MKTSFKPIDLTYEEINPFNPVYPKKLHLFIREKGFYYTPRTLDLVKYRIDLLHKEPPDFLYPQQKKAVKELVKYRYGMMLSGVGSGKSYMMAAIAQMYDGYTLVIAPKKEISKGLYEKFKNLNLQVEVFDKIKFDINNPPKILIIVSKSFNKYREELKLDRIYKQVLIDEVHLELTKNRIRFFCLYQYDYVYGFTGTPELNKYPSEALFKIFNNVYVDSGIWPNKPDVYLILYNSKFKGLDWNHLVDIMYWDKFRLSYFLAHVLEVMKQKDRTMGIIFVQRRDIAEGIAYGLNKLGLPSSAYTGKLSNKQREKILQELTEKKGVMVATYQSVGVGFDWPPLNTAFYFMFVRFKAQVKQAIGRILRGAQNPQYYDFQDTFLLTQRRERLQAYREMRENVRIFKYDLKNTSLWLKCKEIYPEIHAFRQNKPPEDIFEF